MIRTRSIAAMAALSVLACSNSTGPTRWLSGTGPGPEPGLEISGRVSVTRNAAGLTVNLTSGDGRVIRLIGSQEAYLVSVEGADVLVRGAWEAAVLPEDTTSTGPDRAVSSDPDLEGQDEIATNARFIVYAFEVIAVLERSALDGILEATIEGYALRLANGEVRAVTGCPDGFGNLVGQRLWVVGSAEEPPFVYGVIAAM